MKRFLGILDFVLTGNPPWKWRISRGKCPNCGVKLFLSLAPNTFHTRCLGCRANVPVLAPIKVIQKHMKKYKVKDCWEMSTYGATLSFLERTFKNVYKTEYSAKYKSGQIVNNVRIEDVQNLSFKSNSLDLITCNGVFEHVYDSSKGFNECFRVLRNNGALIFTVPLFDIPKTKKIAKIVNGEIVFEGEPEFHHSRIEGPYTIPTFWHYSLQDICDILSEIGFNAEFIDVMITPSQSSPRKVIYAIKKI